MTTDRSKSRTYRFTTITVGLLVIAMALGTTAVFMDDDECTAEIHYQNGSVEEVPATIDDDGVCRPDHDTLVERGYWETSNETEEEQP